MAFPVKDLISLAPLSREDIEELFSLADEMKKIIERPVKKVPTLRGKVVANLFFEPSTRTRTSFELAGKYLGADVINFSSSGSSISKGETLLDTVKNILAMGPDLIVMRHSSSGAPHFVASRIDIPVVNAGDGINEHPSQGLLDMYTIRNYKGSLDGLKIAIIGDIAHSRVARSDILGLSRFDTEITLFGPRTVMFYDASPYNVRVAESLEEAVTDADVVMMLRIQRERQSALLIPSIREYSSFYGISKARLDLLKPDAIIMHPGPVNQGVELTPDVVYGDRSVIFNQVTNGVAIRMAILYTLIGEGKDE